MEGEHRDRMEGDKHTQRKGRIERVKKGRERERWRERGHHLILNKQQNKRSKINHLNSKV